MTKNTLEEFQEIIIKLRKSRFELIDNVKTVVLFDHLDFKINYTENKTFIFKNKTNDDMTITVPKSCLRLDRICIAPDGVVELKATNKNKGIVNKIVNRDFCVWLDEVD